MFLFRSVVPAAALMVAAMAPAAAGAAVIVLDFEGIAEHASVESFYAGGTDSAGGSGVNYGVDFVGRASALIDTDAGGDGEFGNEPSASTILTSEDFYSAGLTPLVINVAAGFDTGFSLYTEATTTGHFLIFDGLNGTGNFLAGYFTPLHSFTLCPQGDPEGYYCDWVASGVAFSGVAKSVVLYSDIGLAFDNMTFGSATPLLSVPEDPGGPVQGVPEPSTWALMILGFGWVGAGLRQRRRLLGAA